MVYTIRRDERARVTGAELVWSTEDLGQYSNLFPIELDGKNHLLGYHRDDGGLDIFHLIDSPPWVNKLPVSARINPGYDHIEPFVMGNLTHLMCYSSKGGAFEFFGLAADGFSLSEPFRYFRDREPTVTLGFTTVKALTSMSQLGILGYNFDDGHVATFRLSVRTTSPPGVPPLALSPVSSHYWARGWTRFAFFRFGGENFFLKTNVVKPNVNIDHVLDDLSGSVPVGSHLDLHHADRLGIVRPVELADEAPHFATYEKTGEVTLNRIRSDCLGWTTVVSFKSKENAVHLVPYAIGSKAMMIVS